MRPLTAFALALAVAACAQQQVRPQGAEQGDGGTRPAAGAPCPTSRVIENRA